MLIRGMIQRALTSKKLKQVKRRESGLSDHIVSEKRGKGVNIQDEPVAPVT
jgi:hypothetical protein